MIIKNGLALVGLPGRRTFREVSIAIEENKIAQIGEFRELKREYGGEVYDAKGALILPGFPNSHMHSAMSLMRGIPDGLTLDEWVKGYIWPFEKSLTDEYSYLGAAVATLESVRNGITLVNEMHLNIESVARSFEDIGIRSVLSVPMMDAPGSLYEDSKSAMEANRNLFRMVERSSGRLKARFGPCTIRLASKNLLEMIADEYREMKKEGKRSGIHMHLCEVKEDVEFSKMNYGMSPAEFLYKIGILNEDAIFAHCVHLDEKDISLLARSGCSVAHCLSSNLKLRSGLANLPMMLSKGVNVSLGIDDTASNDTADMLREARLVALVHAQFSGFVDAPIANRILECIYSGARALNVKAGVIAKGYLADIIVMKRGLQHFPGKNKIGELIYSADGRNVNTVIVDGKFVIRDGEFTNVNEEKLLERAQKASERIWDIVEKRI